MIAIELSSNELEQINGGDFSWGGALGVVAGAVFVGASMATGAGEIIAAGSASGTLIGMAESAYATGAVAFMGYGVKESF